jgi:hypothetical protein
VPLFFASLLCISLKWFSNLAQKFQQFSTLTKDAHVCSNSHNDLPSNVLNRKSRIIFVSICICKAKYIFIYGAFTLDVKSMLNVNLGGILGGTQC